MKGHAYALGMWEMLHLACREHFREYQGLLPKRFEMHPENWCELRMDERMKGLRIDPEKPEFMGVPVVIDSQVDQLRMVTAANRVEYL